MKKKIKIISNLSYQELPVVENMIEIEEKDLKQIGITKQFDGFSGKIVDYVDNSLKISELKQRLSQLSEDLIQSTAGEIIDDIDSRKAEFVKLHNELRVLLGKDERKVE